MTPPATARRAGPARHVPEAVSQIRIHARDISPSETPLRTRCLTALRPREDAACLVRRRSVSPPPTHTALRASDTGRPGDLREGVGVFIAASSWGREVLRLDLSRTWAG